MGDAIMAFWGAPLQDRDHARHALLAGMEMHATMRSLAAQFTARGWPALSIGVGVNTGCASVGNMGSAVRVAYTAMGNVVNTASRLEGLTKQYGVGMIVGEATRTSCPGVVFRELDRVRPKGKNQPLAIYEPIGLEEQVGKQRSDELFRPGLTAKNPEGRGRKKETILYHFQSYGFPQGFGRASFLSP